MNQKWINNEFYFNNIFTSYDIYNSWCIEIGLIIDVEPALNYNQWVYNALFREFYNIPINYDTPDYFKNQLANILFDNFQKYEKEIELIDSIYSLKIEEFAKTRDSITSNAVNNNKNNTDPTKWIGYIGDQSFSSETLSKFQGYLNAISQIPSYRLKDFLDKFRYLFRTIYY